MRWIFSWGDISCLFCLKNHQDFTTFFTLASQKIAIAEKSQRFQIAKYKIAKYKIANFAAEIAKIARIYRRKNRSDFWGARNQNRSVFVFSKSQRFRDAKFFTLKFTESNEICHIVLTPGAISRSLKKIEDVHV